MEACFQLVPGEEDRFFRLRAGMVPLVTAKSGFISDEGGPVIASDWLYFSASFDTPTQMDAWHHDPRHRRVQELARSEVFKTYYIRKWRSPGVDEEYGDWIYSKTEIVPKGELDEGQATEVLYLLDCSLGKFNPAPFETLTGTYEDRPYQLVGPVMVDPSNFPMKYLVLTHWTSKKSLDQWLRSPQHAGLEKFGTVASRSFIPVVQETGSRLGLSASGIQWEWSRG
jgi:heme-degrading monooxygenase HmoA